MKSSGKTTQSSTPRSSSSISNHSTPRSASTNTSNATSNRSTTHTHRTYSHTYTNPRPSSPKQYRGVPPNFNVSNYQTQTPILSSLQIENDLSIPSLDVTPNDVECATLFYDAIRSMKRTRFRAEERKPANSVPIQERIKGTIDELRNTIHHITNEKEQEIESPKVGLSESGDMSKEESLSFLYNIEVLQAKRKIYNFCFEELIDYLTILNPDLGLVVHGLNEAVNRVFGWFPELLRTVHKKWSLQTERVKIVEEKYKEATLAAQLLDRDKQALIRMAKQQPQHTPTQPIVYTNMPRFVDNSLPVPNVAVRRETQTNLYQNQNPEPNYYPPTPTPQYTFSPTPTQNFNNYSVNVSNISGENGDNSSFSNYSNTSFNPTQQNTPNLNSSNNSNPSGNGIRVLSLKQLLDVISEVYQSKVKMDAKAHENRLPTETMEQHLQTFLNQKYGLKSIVNEWVQCIHVGVNKYASEDVEVALFGKILSRDVDDGFRFTVTQIKETVSELLRVYLKGKYPVKSEAHINQLLEKTLKGYISEEEWVDIIKYMYNEEDSHYLIGIVRNFVESSSKIQYSTFIKILLEFQLQGHERFLTQFKALFKQVDHDLDGIISADEFRTLLSILSPHKDLQSVNSQLLKVDPFGCNKITFSESVQCLKHDIMKSLQRHSLQQ
eukprot:TRINITY_DN2109_c2_g1_i2.p1 TRINITY_DN2109_c2_g1~~TRINITY_DN2109_c2_g1_i2.p1  ORF type:complete len:665 (-),score=159.38 TRINITY_DN2109_c2_g1_i2:52-2046(-)